MFGRRKREDDQRPELDAAWDDEVTKPAVVQDDERAELDAAWDDEETPQSSAAERNTPATDTAGVVEDALETSDTSSAEPTSEISGSEPTSEASDSEPTAPVDADEDGFVEVNWNTEASADSAFPEPHAFDLTSDTVPTDAAAREETGDLPFDADESFAYDADSDEFTSGDAVGFLDDSHTDFYEYGEKMHGVHDTPEEPDALGVPENAAIPGRIGRHGSGRTSKQAALDEMPEHQKRSRRMRRILTVVALLLIALMGALAYFGYNLYQESRVAAEAETEEVTTEVDVAVENEELSGDLGTTSTKNVQVASLMRLFGCTQEEALERLGDGAVVTLEAEVTDEASPTTYRTTVVLTDQTADTKSGAPTVYLGFGPDGKVVVAGYSAATASLGYGTLSFIDVVGNQHVVERTLTEAGLPVEDGVVALPKDSTAYTTFASDGVTLVKEQSTFDGTTELDGKPYAWTSVLVYNYTAANATGNLADTVRQVYVYITDTEAADAIFAERERQAAEAAERKAREEEERKAREEEERKAREEEERRAAEEAERAAADEAAAEAEVGE